ncbi:MAG: hypothetical protein ISS80_04740 [Candidatus Cloacimonetes bacterium]|nr:hypothetical protein [Candidatus Cloacimonadota bacterium]MBL7149362.1 hypothetical protein [Candidatus Cloacimonadota bacterium]
MKLIEIQELLEAEVLTGKYDPEKEIQIGCSSDLMSEILAFGKPGSILLTSLKNIQVINTANVADIKAVCFVMGKIPDENIINLAKKNDIVVLITKLTTFESCGRLYKNGLKSCSYFNLDK